MLPRHLIITVHGIRTFGHWQERLKCLLRNIEGDGISVYNYRYGYFSILAFFLPFSSWFVTRRFSRDLISLVASEPWSRIDIVAHSFGTHIVAWALRRLSPDKIPTIHTLILAGSVLRPAFAWHELVPRTVSRLVNECGIRDGALVANQLLVLFSGLAGRVGFNGFTSEVFQNNFYDFGHSGYFLNEQNEPDDGFMVKRWLPLLTSNAPIVAVDERRPLTLFEGARTFLLNNAEVIKIVVYVSLLFAFWGFLQDIQKQRKIADLELWLRTNNYAKVRLNPVGNSSIVGVKKIPRGDGDEPWGPSPPLPLKEFLLESLIIALPLGYYLVEYRLNGNVYPLGVYSQGYGRDQTITLPRPIDDPAFVFIPGGTVPSGDLIGSGPSSERPVSSVELRPYLIANHRLYQPNQGGSHPNDPNAEYLKLSWKNALEQARGIRARLPTSIEWEWAARIGVIDWEKEGGQWEWTLTRAFPLPYRIDDGRENSFALDDKRIACGGLNHSYLGSGIFEDWFDSTVRPSRKYAVKINTNLSFRVAKNLPTIGIPQPWPRNHVFPLIPGDTALRPESINALRYFAQNLLALNKEFELKVLGSWHTMATVGSSLTASQKAAKGVQDILRREGVPEGVMTTIAYGKERPYSSGNEVIDMMKNTVVEVKVSFQVAKSVAKKNLSEGWASSSIKE